MRKYLNTLYVTQEGAYLSKEGQTIVITVDHEKRLQLPAHTIGSIVCLGSVMCSPYLMGFCAQNNISISFLTQYGKFLACVHGQTHGNVLLRRQQYRMADDPEAIRDISRSILIGKICNSRSSLQRTLRDHGNSIDKEAIQGASSRLKNFLTKLNALQSINELRGMEGESAHTYFGVFDHLIVSQKDAFVFTRRSRRPPLDRVNCLLSFLYTLIGHDMRSALETVGLDPAVGFLHTDRPGRFGLALDLIEEFRPWLADRLALSLINLKQVRDDGITQSESGACVMDDETRKTVLVAYQKRKQEELMHPFLEEKAPIGLLFYIQAMLFARFVRGDMDGYPVFFMEVRGDSYDGSCQL